MNIGIGALVLCLTVYTAKSFYVEGNGEILDNSQLQRLSDAANDAVEAEVKVNLLPTTTVPRLSSLFNFNKINLFIEIEKNDVIEIEVPVIGIDYVKVGKEQMSKDENSLEINEDVDINSGYAEVKVFTTKSSFDLSTKDDALTFAADFQTSPIVEATNQNIVETTTQAEPQVDDADTTTIDDEAVYDFTVESHTDRIQTVESILLEQRAADNTMTDGSFESKQFTEKSQRYPKYPLNFKIMENKDDEKKSCKSKTSCRQVRATRPTDHDIDPEYYVEYSDEASYFENEPLRNFDRPSVLRSRNAKRAADDMNVNVFTPAPRFQPFQPLQALQGIKKPAFIEQLENESSLERSERINKNLDGLMRLVGVWAHVDKFISDRARNAVQRLAYLTGDDYGDDILGSKRGYNRKRAPHDPFT